MQFGLSYHPVRSWSYACSQDVTQNVPASPKDQKCIRLWNVVLLQPPFRPEILGTFKIPLIQLHKSRSSRNHCTFCYFMSTKHSIFCCFSRETSSGGFSPKGFLDYCIQISTRCGGWLHLALILLSFNSCSLHLGDIFPCG